MISFYQEMILATIEISHIVKRDNMRLIMVVLGKDSNKVKNGLWKCLITDLIYIILSNT